MSTSIVPFSRLGRPSVAANKGEVDDFKGCGRKRGRTFANGREQACEGSTKREQRERVGAEAAEVTGAYSEPMSDARFVCVRWVRTLWRSPELSQQMRHICAYICNVFVYTLSFSG